MIFFKGILEIPEVYRRKSKNGEIDLTKPKQKEFTIYKNPENYKLPLFSKMWYDEESDDFYIWEDTDGDHWEIYEKFFKEKDFKYWYKGCYSKTIEQAELNFYSDHTKEAMNKNIEWVCDKFKERYEIEPYYKERYSQRKKPMFERIREIKINRSIEEGKQERIKKLEEQQRNIAAELKKLKGG